MNYASIFISFLPQLPPVQFSVWKCTILNHHDVSGKLEESSSIAPSLLLFTTYVLQCLAIDLGHFMVVGKSFCNVWIIL